MAAVALAAGIALSSLAPLPETATLAALATAALLLATAACRRSHRHVPWLVACLFVALGMLRGAPLHRPPPAADHIGNLITGRTEATLIGVLAEPPSGGADRWRLLLETEAYRTADGRHGPARGPVRLTMAEPPPVGLMPGDRLLVRARLAPPAGFQTPGVSDYARHLAYQGILVTGWIDSPALIRPLAGGGTPHRFRPDLLAARLRARIGRLLDTTLTNERQRALYRAVLIGDRGAMPAAVLENFRAAGCMHLLAISGVHMGLVALALSWAVTALARRSPRLLLRLPAKKLAALAALVPLAGYALIAGLGPPVVRALIMIAALLAAVLSDRQWSLAHAIAVAALAILLIQPADLFSLSFELSFAAIIGIALFLPAIRPHLDESHGPRPWSGRLRSWLLAGVLISAAAMAATLPLAAASFHRVALISPLATLLVEPFLCLWAVLPGLAAIVTAPLAPPLAAALLHTGGAGITIADQLTVWLARLPFPTLWLPTPTGLETVLYFTALILWARRRSLPPARPAAFLAAALLGLSLATTTMARRADDRTRLTVLDVGQGSSTVIELPHGRTIVVDGGGPATDRFEVGERVIAPFLWYRRIGRLEAVVVTHPHADHMNGLFFVLERFRPRLLWVNGDAGSTALSRRLLNTARRLGIEVRRPAAGEMLFARDGVTLRCLGGPTAPALASGLVRWPQGFGTNDRSLVLRLDTPQASFLLPGDIGPERSDRLIAAGRDLDVEVLLAPHHGDPKATTDRLLAAASPRYLAISTGRGHGSAAPNPEAIAAWRRAGIEVFTTAADGAVSFETGPAGLAVTPYRSSGRGRDQTSVKSVGGFFRN